MLGDALKFGLASIDEPIWLNLNGFEARHGLPGCFRLAYIGSLYILLSNPVRRTCANNAPTGTSPSAGFGRLLTMPFYQMLCISAHFREYVRTTRVLVQRSSPYIKLTTTWFRDTLRTL